MRLLHPERCDPEAAYVLPFSFYDPTTGERLGTPETSGYIVDADTDAGWLVVLTQPLRRDAVGNAVTIKREMRTEARWHSDWRIVECDGAERTAHVGDSVTDADLDDILGRLDGVGR